MKHCARCGSSEINEGNDYPLKHGRSLGVDGHLCDVCYWRGRAEMNRAVLVELADSVEYWSEYDVPLGIIDRIKEAIRI